LQNYQSQINQANAFVNQLEQQRQEAQNAANYWNSQINIWEIVRYERQCRRVLFWRSCRDVPIGGWIYNPQAVANRNDAQAAANAAAEYRDIAAQKAQVLTADLQPQITALQQQISGQQQQLQSLAQQQQALQSQSQPTIAEP
jgi:flagellar biosynthesis chaperone FliJ